MPQYLICSMPGVSNTQPAGRMWPARPFYVARVIIKIILIIVKTIVLCGIRAHFTSFCGPRRHFYLFMWIANSFFIKMWPAYIFQYETPALCQKKSSLHQPGQKLLIKYSCNCLLLNSEQKSKEPKSIVFQINFITL